MQPMNPIEPEVPGFDLPAPVDDGGTHPVVPWLNERRRAYFYRLALALVALAVLVGWVAAPVAGAIIVVITAGLGLGLAAKNTSTARVVQSTEGMPEL